MRIAALLTLASAALVPALVAPGSASAGEGGSWMAPERVLESRHGINSLEVAAARRGYAIVVWSMGGAQPLIASGGKRGRAGVFASVRRPESRRFGRSSRISPRGAVAPRLGVGAGGETIVAWISRRGRPQAVFRKPHGGWSDPQTLGPGPVIGSIGLNVAVDGGAAVAWASGPAAAPTLRAATRMPRKSFAPSQVLANASDLGVFFDVAMARGGLGAVAWDPPCSDPVRATFTDAAGVFQSFEQIPNSRCPNVGVRIGVDDHGGAVVVIGRDRNQGTVSASVRSPGGEFTPAMRISDGRAIGGEVAVSGEGRAIALWSLASRRRPRGVAAAIRSPHGPFRRARRISGRAGGGLEQLAMNHRGSAVAAWQSLRSFRIQASTSRQRGGFSPAKNISPALSKRNLAEIAAAVSPRGRSLVAWTAGLGSVPSRAIYVSAQRKHPMHSR
jgi:hypothetical protein